MGAGQRYEYVLVEQDINTLAEDRDIRRFDSGQLSEFLRSMSTEFDTVLGLYFPANG